jgi:short-subunit dehydrogenase involved in D-alanine esterification of teichoic acids
MSAEQVKSLLEKVLEKRGAAYVVDVCGGFVFGAQKGDPAYTAAFIAYLQEMNEVPA